MTWNGKAWRPHCVDVIEMQRVRVLFVCFNDLNLDTQTLFEYYLKMTQWGGLVTYLLAGINIMYFSLSDAASCNGNIRHFSCIFLKRLLRY